MIKAEKFQRFSCTILDMIHTPEMLSKCITHGRWKERNCRRLLVFLKQAYAKAESGFHITLHLSRLKRSAKKSSSEKDSGFSVS